MTPNATLTVVYSGEPDEVFEFAQEGLSRTFGRDDTLCDIVIWSALNGTDLSRVAGRIWRMDGELWVRNLSTKHELTVSQPDYPEEAPLRPRVADGFDPGPARSVPGEIAYIRAPGGCELVVRQTRRLPEPEDVISGDMTTRVPDVPAGLRPVAAALCEPLLSGGQLPAAYSDVMRRLGETSLKRTRVMVAELCALYAQEVPQLRERVSQRIRREEVENGLASSRRLKNGIWSFDPSAEAAAPPDPEEARRRALALPEYYEVAHLLVRRRLITRADVDVLPEPAPRPADSSDGS